MSLRFDDTLPRTIDFDTVMDVTKSDTRGCIVAWISLLLSYYLLFLFFCRSNNENELKLHIITIDSTRLTVAQ